MKGALTEFSELLRDTLPAPVYTWLDGAVEVLLIYLGFLVLERLKPAERGQAGAAILFNFRWWILYSAMTALLMYWMFGALTPWVRAWTGGPLLHVGTGGGTWGLLGRSMLFFLVFDFFYYWFHRAQHGWSFLWQQHRLHHTERVLNVTTTQRHHWLEEPLRVFFISVPMALLIDVSRTHVGILGFGLGLWGFFIHANLKLRLGPLTPVIVGPQVHRIHHSVVPEHQGMNLGAYFPIWDILFGTYWRPASDEFPPAGLSEDPPPRGVFEASWDPFAAWLSSLRSH